MQGAFVMKLLPIGISDYKRLVEGGYYYIDKTLLIKELFQVGGLVTLLPRPRRFGKTLNLSMLYYFFEQSKVSNDHLFSHTAIGQEEKYRDMQGKYPVIFLTFKDVKELTWDSAYEKIKLLIAKEFERHAYLLENISEYTALDYRAILNKTANQVLYERSLLFLTELLHKYYGTRVIFLLDEYDSPIHASYTHSYYDQIMPFMRSLLTAALKDNSHIERGVLTGILRVAKESVFSGLNNLKVCSLTSSSFQDKFGFTQQEVKQLLKDQKLSDKGTEVGQWYNGYTFGATTIYNPWSIISCAQERGLLQPYWINTSDNALIKKLITLASDSVKSELELLVTGQEVIQEIDDAVLFPGIEHNDKALWSLLLFTGYLTYTKQDLVEGVWVCSLKIPNKEIKSLYISLIKEIVQSSLADTKIKLLLKAIGVGDSQLFGELLQEFVMHSMSSFDLPDNEPEKSYHLFVLGLLVLLGDSYEVKSNRESGYGRYDIMLIARKPHQMSIVIEFKKVLISRGETLETAAQKALEQVRVKEYVHELNNRGVKNIQLLGIAFQGKNIFVMSENVLDGSRK